MPQDIQRTVMPDLEHALFKVPNSAHQSPIPIEDFPAMTPQPNKERVDTKQAQQSLKAQKRKNLTLIEVSKMRH